MKKDRYRDLTLDPDIDKKISPGMADFIASLKTRRDVMQPSYNVSIYRSSGPDCSNGGPSATFDRAILYREAPKVPVPHPGYAVFVLRERMIAGEPYLDAVPLDEKRWIMFGGNFLWSCDSWFRQEVSERPIPIHDRVEG